MWITSNLIIYGGQKMSVLASSQSAGNFFSVAVHALFRVVLHSSGGAVNAFGFVEVGLLGI